MFQKKNNKAIDEVNENQAQSKNKITDLIKESLGGIRDFMDANTVTGNPIETPSGTIIIPISKVSMGFAAGGNDYANKDSAPDRNNFGGGGGTGLTVIPVGFLVVDKGGDVEFLNVGMKGKPDPVDQIADFVERTPDIIAKIKDLFAKEPKPEDTV